MKEMIKQNIYHYQYKSLAVTAEPSLINNQSICELET